MGILKITLAIFLGLIFLSIILGLRSGLNIDENHPYEPPKFDEDDIPHIDDLRD